MLQDLMVSKVRAKLLQTFFSQPKEMFYIRQLVRLINEEINFASNRSLPVHSDLTISGTII